ncbi:nicotinate phosphoribosyltransferase [Hymenobacter taeanensis]|uniref:Nicotinate phosphoribosyltransferase n=1 Tax=Hymenobacter taeanensis TaxID=2735321 RepID=A0A6M6BDQ3_9BACT|nr:MULTISPECIES: nicotinate phosphoribosyltransferase [Hymenobacter]QJX46357.1 nicotinate phosphoribosyltransferase [Hymenobacter taeanensis]UOQ80218.1 nicotinate phosphoribosyltransferase [Hymenobacter sp. 5414T-23]
MNSAPLSGLYAPSLSLLTDLYQVTMAYGYWQQGMQDREAVFHLYFRRPPFDGGYAVCAGLAYAADWLQNLHFSADDLAYLGSLKSAKGGVLFPQDFLDYLRDLKFTCDVDAIAEGTVVFANEPLIRVQGPLLQAQLIETALLTLVNFQTLVATKAVRIREAAGDDTVLEFGLRRAQGFDGGLSASRAAYLGGVDATSNVLAGQRFNIPVKGTHAHSWVMAFKDEAEAFTAYAKAFPDDSVFLVDTYDTLEGVRNAIKVAREMRANGHELGGIRLDSGDLAYLSREARALLNEAGFPNVRIVASNDLEENLITSLKLQGAKIDTWGIGTQLVTAYDQPALGGVYKMAALRKPDDSGWDFTIKLSEQLAKTSIPGILQVRRYENEKGQPRADMLYNTAEPLPDQLTIIDPSDYTRRRPVRADAPYRELLEPIFRGGELVHQLPTLQESRARAQREVLSLDPSIRRFLNPHTYPVGLEESLNTFRTNLILEKRPLRPA